MGTSDVRIGIDTQVTPTTAPVDVSYTDSTALDGATGVGAILMAQTDVTIGGYDAGDAYLSYGFMEAGSQGVSSISMEDAVSTTVTWRWTSAGMVLAIPNVADGVSSVDGVKDTGAPLIADGWTMTVTDEGGSAYHTASLLFAGADIEIDVGRLTMHATQDTGTVVVDCGFEPDLILFSTAMAASSIDDGAAAFAGLCTGACVNDVGLTQRFTSFGSNDGGASVVTSYVASDRALGQVFNGAKAWTGEVTAIAASPNSFTITTRDGGSGSDAAFYMAIKVGDLGVKIFDYDTPTSTGVDSLPDLGFVPQAGMLHMNRALAQDSIEIVADDASVFGMLMFTDTAQYQTMVWDEDASSTTNTGQRTDDNIAIPGGDGSATQDLVGVLSIGGLSAPTIDFSAVDDGNSRAWWGWAIEKVGTGGTVPSLALLGVGT